MDEWIRAHVEDVPRETYEFCGDLLKDAKVLNVGCGEMLADFGLLGLGPRSITGLDVNHQPDDWKNRIAERIVANGHGIPDDYAERLSFVPYNGSEFPFEDSSFECIFSWSAFEHIDDMGTVLREMRRVLIPQGKAFVQVYPWYASIEGSHLTPWIRQPWFHLTERDSWVRLRLAKHVERHGGEEFLMGHMYPEYVKLNRHSASDFYQAARESGFLIEKARLLAGDEDLSDAPGGIDFADLMIRGTMMLMRKGGGREALSRNRQV